MSDHPAADANYPAPERPETETHDTSLTEGENTPVPTAPDTAQAEGAAVPNEAEAEYRLPKRARRPFLLLPILVLTVGVVILIIILANSKSNHTEPYRLFSKGLTPVAEVATDEGGNPFLRWGYINKNGELAIAYREGNSNAPFSTNGLAPAADTAGLWGYIDTDGNFAIAPAFEATDLFDGLGFGRVMMGGSWGYINKKGEIVINPQFDEADAFAENGLALVCIGGKYGYINKKGVYVIPPQFDDARAFDNDYAIVKAFGKWGMIDARGNYVINPQFDAFEPFSENKLALVCKDGKYGYINRSGVYKILPAFSDAGSFAANGLAYALSAEGKYGYIDKTGEWVISAQFDTARDFADNGLALVLTAEHTCGYIDREGNFAIAPTYTGAMDFCYGLAPVYTDGAFVAYLDKDGEQVITFEEAVGYAGSFSEDGFALVIFDRGDTAAIALVNRKGEILFEAVYETDIAVSIYQLMGLR